MQKVFVGLSGGVDSAVSAALLKSEGYDVTGVFIKIWQPAFIECTWEKDRIDAMRVAAALRIPFLEVDLSDEYEKEVIQGMTRAYSEGFTPNPDVSCNERIKFGAFAAWAHKNGADIVATGHYARIEQRDGEFALLRGADSEKDQSYFLYRISREQLARTRFPVGGLTKTKVRALAVKYGLPVAHKRDSQGLCFVGDVSMRDFLKRFITIEGGEVLDVSGRVVGRHEGAPLYTVGQRHGFEVSGASVPHFVTRVDVRTNALTVSPHTSDCERLKAPLRDIHWLSQRPFPIEASVQARYREEPVRALLTNDSVTFNEPHIVSPGQDLVAYDGDRCLGGARIR